MGAYKLIKENQKILSAVNVIADGFIVICAMLIAYITRFLILQGTENLPFGFYIYSSIAVSPLFVLLFGNNGTL